VSFDGFPLVLAWELTLACNLRCRHCGSSAGLARDHELSLEEALSLCDQLPAMLVQEVDFTGGEPLVYPGWHLIAARLAEHTIRTQIITNALAVDRDTIALMKEVGIVSVGFSLDGLEHTHDTIRGHQGLFRRVFASIDLAQEAGLRTAVLTTVNAMNLEELPLMLPLLQSAGVRQWQLQPVFPLGRASGAAELEMSPETYLRLGRFVQEWVPRAEDNGFHIQLADSLGYFTEYDVREAPWRGCPAGLVACGIASDGKVKGCLSLPDHMIEGDLREDDFWDIWFRPDAFAFTRGYSQAELGDNCAFCEHADICKGGCSAMSCGSTGVFHNDPYCFHGIRNRPLAA
jgi:radical SAM protein with 4Fe4S-binding SPASM domain